MLQNTSSPKPVPPLQKAGIFLNTKIRRNWGKLRSVVMTFDIVKQMLIPFSAAISALVSFALTISDKIDLSGFTSVALILFIFFLIYQIANILLTYRRYAHGYRIRSAKAEKADIQSAWKIGSTEAADGYTMCFFDNGNEKEYYLESADFNNLLRSGVQIPCNHMKCGFSLPEEVRDLVPAIVNDVFGNSAAVSDGKLLRQASHIEIQQPRVLLQSVHYLQGKCTHEIVYKKFIAPDKIGLAFDGKKLLMDQDNTLYDLTCSPNGNFLGATTLVITRHHILITKQGAFSDANKERFAPSGSGSVKYSDVKKARKYYKKSDRKEKNAVKHPFNDILRYAMEREFCEECHYRMHDIKKHMSTMLVGYVRLMEKGGKPDYFGITYLDMDLSDKATKHGPDNIRLTELGLMEKGENIPYQSIEQIPDLLECFIQKHSKPETISIQLHLTAKYLRQMQEDHTLKASIEKLQRQCGVCLDPLH